MRGVPQLYYGDEYGLQSADGTVGHSQERVDMPWGKFTREQIVLRKYVSDLFTWRKSSKAVAQGNFIHFRPDAANVYVYFRTVKGECVMTILNGGKEDYVVDWPHFSEITANFAKKGKNIMTGERFRLGDKLVVAPGESMVLEFK
jgi:glycosidase